MAADARELRHFRRRHRLTAHTVLYVGPYTREGGLHDLLDAALSLRSEIEDVVVAAIPEGAVDRRYRDACERQALALGHRGIVEWEVSAEDRELWLAAATAVCRPGDLADGASALRERLAAAEEFGD